MKIKTFLFIWLTVLFFSLPSHAYDVWHTPSGKSYEVYVSVKVGEKKKDAGFYIVSYKTKRHLDDRYGLLLEYYDLLTHLYYFHLSPKLRNNKFSTATIEAFREFPKSRKHKTPSRRFTKRLSELKTLVKKHKKIDWNRLKAFQKFNQKKYQQAVSFFKKVKKKVPHDYYQTANAYLLLANKDEALKHLQSGLKRYPKEITLLNNLAMTTMLTGTYQVAGKYEYDPQKMKEAKTILARALKLDKNNPLTTSNMAVLETTVQNFKAAEKLYLKALKLSKNSAEFSYQMADFYHERKQYKKAKKYYKKTLSKLKEMRSPATEKRVEEIKKRLKLVEQKKAAQ